MMTNISHMTMMMIISIVAIMAICGWCIVRVGDESVYSKRNR